MRNDCATSELKERSSTDNAGVPPQDPSAPAPLCQVWSVATICGADGRQEMVRLPWRTRTRLWLRKRMNGPFKRAIKKTVTDHVARLRGLGGRVNETARPPVEATRPPLKAGDLVRVRSRQEIQATLNPWGELKGCAFMDGMSPYCGTIQRVFKSVERFMDERNYQMRKARGIVLLENVICEGTESLGRCDRSCLFFWREQWLERIEGGPESTTPPLQSTLN